MAEYLIQSETLDDIANAINAKTGGSSAMTPAQMVAAIGNIPSGGGSAPVLLVDQTASEAVSVINVPFPSAADDYAVFLFVLTGSVSNGDWVYPAFNTNTPGSAYFDAEKYHKFTNAINLDYVQKFVIPMSKRGALTAEFPIQNAVFGAYSPGTFSEGFNIKIYGIVRWDDIENYV